MLQLSKLRRNVGQRILRWANASAFEEDFLPRVPPELHSACRWIFAQHSSREERSVARQVEAFRGRIVQLAGAKSLRSMSSPMPGTFALDERGHSAGAPLTPASAEAHARTGVKPKGGILLRRLVDALALDEILELGTNTGMSGAYMLSANRKPHLTTVEGSPDLCAIAQHCLGAHSTSFSIINDLFDSAIDKLVEQNKRFDAVFIDGQHEEEATIHYADRVDQLLKPGGVVIFDDIYWSHGMLAAWHTLMKANRYQVTADLAWKGLAIRAEGIAERLLDPPSSKVNIDLCEYVGRPSLAYKDR